jgi:hypothetical protein
MLKGAATLSNDTDFVKYTTYSQKAGDLPDLPRDPPPHWQLLDIDNPRNFGEAHIPDDVKRIRSPYLTFFF